MRAAFSVPPGGYPARVLTSVVAIGDELLGGFTLDTHSNWLAHRLRLLRRRRSRLGRNGLRQEQRDGTG